MTDNDKGFVVQYFSDGTYDAYRKYRSREPNDTDSAKHDPSFSFVFEGEPIKGKWDSDDGFFQLQPDGKRSYVGTVCFDSPVPGDVAPSGWEGASKAPDPVQHEDGSWSQVGPPLFRGLAYSGKPGDIRLHIKTVEIKQSVSGICCTINVSERIDGTVVPESSLFMIS